MHTKKKQLIIELIVYFLILTTLCLGSYFTINNHFKYDQLLSFILGCLIGYVGFTFGDKLLTILFKDY